MNTPTILTFNGRTAGNITRWMRDGFREANTTDVLSITIPGRYDAYDVQIIDLPGEGPTEFWPDQPSATIIIPALEQSLDFFGPNPLSATQSTLMFVSSNAAGYISKVEWLRNNFLENGVFSTSRVVNTPGVYSAWVTYTYNQESVVKVVPGRNVGASPDAPQIEFKRSSDFNTTITSYNPVSPPVLNVKNFSRFTEFQIIRNSQMIDARGNPNRQPTEFTINNQGTYSIGGQLVGFPNFVFTVDIEIPRGDIPVPPVQATNGGLLTYDKPNLVLSTPAGYHSYTWSRDGQSIGGATTRQLTVTQPGIYTVTGCATYPDGFSQCKTSQPIQVTGEKRFINAVGKRISLVENIATVTQLDALPYNQSNTTIGYFDGFARPVQNLAQASSPLGKDVVTFHTYDAFSRETKQLLPYVRNTTDGAFKIITPSYKPLRDFYQNNNDKIVNSAFPYAETLYEASPLNRVLQQGAPGEEWQLSTGHVRRMEYGNNTASDNIWIWKPAGAGLTATEVYPASALSVIKTIDENGNPSRVFQDKQGQNVCIEKTGEGSLRLRTYFVFDDLNKLTFVIPPKTIEELQISGNTVSISADVLAKECYSYVYDTRGRLTTKKIPGAGAAYTVYDPWNRVVLTQHANQRTRNKWLFNKYDNLGRIILSGEFTLAGDLATAQQAVNTFYATVASTPTLRYEETGTSVHGYTNRSYPVLPANAQVYQVNYYDNYAFLSDFGTGYQFVQESALGLSASSTQTTSLLTGTKTLILGTTTYLKAATYYDAKHRPIQIIAENHTGSIDRASTQLDFTSRVLKTKMIHNGPQSVTVLEEFTYDHAGRKLQAYHTINNGPRILLCDYQYNELGQLVEKNIHSTDGSHFLQSLDYTYNIRGWLLNTNNGETDPNATYPDQYGFSLSYTSSPDNTSGFTPSFNGNIAAFGQTRPGTLDGSVPATSVYNYRYDTRDQLKEAKYFQSGQDGRFDMPVITYDANGNIQTLQRKGITTSGAPGVIDNLNYFYNGNQLIRINDSADATKGFINR